MSDTLMWEVRAAPGRQQDLLAWVEATAVPELTATEHFAGADVYLGGQDRVVVIARWTAVPPRLPDPPEELLARPVAQWPFQHHSTVTP
ncbi:hypothetical protein AB0K15_06680 [Amycolatopsis sp. NPDC049253]|jgi:hypothetical protein|uniref:hypothetical protein n=1 Tax=Amycolatopsis sp. NPDC049253 TaxID=3155274 RepID=UPI0034279496